MASTMFGVACFFLLSVAILGGASVLAQEVGVGGVGAGETRLGRSLSQRSAMSREPEVVKPTAQPILPETLERLSQSSSKTTEGGWLQGFEQWVGPKGLAQSVQTLLMLTLLSAAPAALLMTTCYVRVVIVLGILKQALGNQQLPPAQVLSGISLFVTLFVMSPVWKQVYDDAIVPYTAAESTMRADEAWERGIAPVHRFMARQIAMAGNYEDVHFFYSRYAPQSAPPDDFQSVPMVVLLPAFMLSELRTW